MTLPLPAGGPRGLGADAAAALVAATAGKTAAAIGPGLGTGAGTFEVARGFALGLPLPLVIDADGLNAFEGALERLRERTSPTVLTPHPGELGRLLGMPTAEVVRRTASARCAEAARRSGAIVVLKGHRTLMATPDGEVWINPTGNPGMATGGTGDVLTGMLARAPGAGIRAVGGGPSSGVRARPGRRPRRWPDRRARPAGQRPDRRVAGRLAGAGRELKPEDRGMRRWRSGRAGGDATVSVRSWPASWSPTGPCCSTPISAWARPCWPRGSPPGSAIDPREVQSPTFTLIREHAAAAGGSSTSTSTGCDPEEVEATGPRGAAGRAGRQGGGVGGAAAVRGPGSAPRCRSPATASAG